MERISAKDLQVGTEYWLDDSNQVSGVCTEVNEQNDTVYFDPVPGQPERYVANGKGKIIFPIKVPYEYLKVEA